MGQPSSASCWRRRVRERKHLGGGALSSDTVIECQEEKGMGSPICWGCCLMEAYDIREDLEEGAERGESLLRVVGCGEGGAWAEQQVHRE